MYLCTYYEGALPYNINIIFRLCPFSFLLENNAWYVTCVIIRHEVYRKIRNMSGNAKSMSFTFIERTLWRDF